jgi:hypothetical protein
MKRINLLALFILLSLKSFSGELYLKSQYFTQRGDYGYFYKPGVSVELGLIENFEPEKKTRRVYSLNYKNYSPRQAFIPGNVTNEFNRIHVEYTKLSNIRELHLLVGVDRALIKNDKFILYAGIDADVFYTSFKSGNYTEDKLLIHEFVNKGYGTSVRFRLGGQYYINERISVFANYQNLLSLMLISMETDDVNFLVNSNEFGLGVAYKLNAE